MKIVLNSQKNPLDATKWETTHKGKEPLVGLVRHPTTTGRDGTIYDFPSFTFPEFGPARFFPENHFNLPKTFVADIAGRRWKISIRPRYDDGFPEEVTATFEETTEPETPFSTEKPQATVSQVFGQPKFLQSEVFPQLDGRCGAILAVIESDWGDAGNENIFLALDENGIPAGIYHEFSCC